MLLSALQGCSRQQVSRLAFLHTVCVRNVSTSHLSGICHPCCHSRRSIQSSCFSLSSPSVTARSSPSSSSSILPANWALTIGLEVHAQLLTHSKLFSASSSSFGSAPNVHTSLLDASFPGTLPLLNQSAVLQILRVGIAIGGKIRQRSTFDRKHYYYADLPAAYQITQLRTPFVQGGRIFLEHIAGKESNADKESNTATLQKENSVGISHIQLEHDSGKSIHDIHPSRSFVDLNRSGVPLIEIVSLPELTSSANAALYIRALTQILQTLGVSRAQMEEGSLRVDINVSVRPRASSTLGQRVEIKNINSIRSLVRAIEFEARRQIAQYENGGTVERETRGFNAKTGETFLLRSKENLLDYRFCPEPDVPAITVSNPLINAVRCTLPSLPHALYGELKDIYGLKREEAQVLVSETGAAEYFKRCLDGDEKRKSSNWIKKTYSLLVNDLFKFLNKKRTEKELQRSGELTEENSSSSSSIGSLMSFNEIESEQIVSIVELLESEQISLRNGKLILEKMMDGDRRLAKEIAKAFDMMQISDIQQLDPWCEKIINSQPRFLEWILHSPKEKDKQLYSALVAELLAATNQKANPVLAHKLFAEKVQKMRNEKRPLEANTPSDKKDKTVKNNK